MTPETILCICDEEYCLCSRLVPLTPEVEAAIMSGADYLAPCAECVSGNHVWSTGQLLS